MKEIDKLMSANFPVSVEEKAEIDTITAAGKTLLEEGKTEEASKELEKAIKILKMAEDSDIFNKAD